MSEINYKWKWDWSVLTKEERRKVLSKADKSQLGQVDGAILGRYAALDAWICRQLLTKVMLPVVRKFPVYEEYHTVHFVNEVQLLIMQQLGGILIDIPKMQKYSEKLVVDKAEALKAFLTNEKVVEFVDERTKQVREELLKEEPPKFSEVKVKAEPKKYNIDGTISRTWEKWNSTPPPEQKVSHKWQVWENRLHKETEKASTFNPGSGVQLKDFFYEYLKFPIIVYTKNKECPGPAVDGNARKGFGECGKLLDILSDLTKETQYVDKCLEMTNPTTSTFHPQFKAPGTLTGRLSGSGGLSIHQIPKSGEFLECWKARPGTKWICWDFSALEMVVMAELTRDKSLLKIYGPDALPNDVYLFTASNLPKIGKKVRDAGYDPDNPTKEGVASAKKLCKTERQIGKILTLSAGYGASAGKIRQSLALQGVELSMDEARSLHAGYWELYKGVKDYEAFLISQWEKTGGWVLCGMGMPMAVNERKIKDLTNSTCQRTGHNVLMLTLTLVRKHLMEQNIPHHWPIVDWHDAYYLEVPESCVEQVVRITDEIVVKELKEQLGGFVTHKGIANVVSVLAEDKVEGYHLED